MIKKLAFAFAVAPLALAVSFQLPAQAAMPKVGAIEVIAELDITPPYLITRIWTGTKGQPGR